LNGPPAIQGRSKSKDKNKDKSKGKSKGKNKGKNKGKDPRLAAQRTRVGTWGAKSITGQSH